MRHAPPVLARVYRGRYVESVHRGSIAVVDEEGRLLSGCGEPDAPVFARSAAKPFQALPLLLAGGERRFRLGDAHVALTCASHGGEPRHVRVAGSLLRRGGFGVGDLVCGAHWPMHDPSARALMRRGESPSALHNNCSGKHAGMLLACRALGLPTESYADAAHPLQRRIADLLAEYSGVPRSEISTGVDGCSLPVFRLPLSGLAAAYARLMSRRLAGESPAGAAARARVVRAMTRRPEMVAGSGRFTTDFIAAGGGRWIGKEGAEGVYAIGLAAGPAEPAVGIAFKIEDGSARPRDAVALGILGRLGRLSPRAGRVLARYARPVLHNAAGLEVGYVEAEPPLAAAGRRAQATA